MLKNNGKKTAISVATTACLCLLLLLVAVQHHRVQVDEEAAGGEDAGTRSLLQDAARAEEEEQDAQLGSAPAKRGFSAYFTKLTRGRREVEKPARSSASAADPPPAEDISPDDIFIAVKTTKKFHQSRLNLLLDTWISRNMQQVKEKLLDVIHVAFICTIKSLSLCMHKLKIRILGNDMLVCGLISLLQSLTMSQCTHAGDACLMAALFPLSPDDTLK